ncbi:hypothetical protein TEA_016237 [Camellia sinensis var. sinensis]|uniref:Exportin-1/Importin-beta-like domain-containing protein n=1 Tax=Camellia sinensis var. sinensis TaxID=542762 RepID=A0A4S4D042_CAMSN|nr:hypothetical protein TEA_016237 [Camellia sinensis var. sinensis]
MGKKEFGVKKKVLSSNSNKSNESSTSSNQRLKSNGSYGGSQLNLVQMKALKFRSVLGPQQKSGRVLSLFWRPKSTAVDLGVLIGNNMSVQVSYEPSLGPKGVVEGVDVVKKPSILVVSSNSVKIEEYSKRHEDRDDYKASNPNNASQINKRRKKKLLKASMVLPKFKRWGIGLRQQLISAFSSNYRLHVKLGFIECKGDSPETYSIFTVSDNLLHDASSNQETLIFCSQTLRSKVQRDFEELPSEAFRPLRDSLNSLLKTFHKGPPKVRTQISLAVAALAVHVPAKDWGDGGIVSWLRDEMNSHPECIPSFLELLRVLPEEVFNYKISARPDRRRQFEKELTSAMEIALNILSACLNINELKEQVLEAFASWLRLRHRIPASTLASHPLVLTALSSLNSDILSEASVNGICSAHCSQSDVKTSIV